MSILVIGSTGTIGTHVVESLARRGADVTALIHKNKGKFPGNVKTVKGDTTDADSMRAALTGINTVFLLNPVVADELNRALLVLNATQEFGIERLVYFSMFHSDVFLDCPHANAKYATELMIERFGLSTTILRPNYFFQNDGKPVVELGVYPEPIGSLGVTMVDARDIAEIAAISLIRRDQSPDALPTERIEIHGPDVVTSQSAVALWSEVLGRNITYLGDDLRAARKPT